MHIFICVFKTGKSYHIIGLNNAINLKTGQYINITNSPNSKITSGKHDREKVPPQTPLLYSETGVCTGMPISSMVLFLKHLI